MGSCFIYFPYVYSHTYTRSLQHIKNNSLWTKTERLDSSPGRYQVNTVVDKRFGLVGWGPRIRLVKMVVVSTIM